MKKLVTLLFIANFAIAQDTIRFRNGEVQAVKVNEVGVSDIKYNRFDNVSGPQYVVDKNDIRSIKYSGGFIDSFAIVKPPVKVTEFKTVSPIVGADKIIISGNRLIYRGKGLGESRLFKMVKAYPEGGKKNAMMQTFMQMKTYKKKQYLFGYIGLGVGVVAAYLGAVSGFIAISGYSVPTPLIGIVVIGASVGIGGAIISGKYKRKRTNEKLNVAKIFNN